MNFVLSDCYFATLLRAILWTLGWSWPWCFHASNSLLSSVWHRLMLAILPLMTVDTSMSAVQMVSVLPGLCACVSSSYNAITSTMKMTDIAILQWSFTMDVQCSLPRVSRHSLLLLPFQATIAHTFFFKFRSNCSFSGLFSRFAWALRAILYTNTSVRSLRHTYLSVWILQIHHLVIWNISVFYSHLWIPGSSISWWIF